MKFYQAKNPSCVDTSVRNAVLITFQTEYQAALAPGAHRSEKIP